MSAYPYLNGVGISPVHCVLHGYHGMQTCPKCSSCAPIPLTTHPPGAAMVPEPDLSWLYKAGYEAGYAAAQRERDLTPRTSGRDEMEES